MKGRIGLMIALVALCIATGVHGQPFEDDNILYSETGEGYLCSDAGDWVDACTNAYDADWGTGARAGMTPGEGWIYINRTITNMHNIGIRLKSGNTGKDYNITIPNSCTWQNNLSMFIISYYSDSTVRLYCNTTTGTEQVYETTGGGNGGGWIYEEGMYYYKAPRINITFNPATNWTLVTDTSSYNEDGTSQIFNYTEDIGYGDVKVSFADYQIMDFRLNENESLEEYAYVMPIPDKNQEIKVMTTSKVPIEDAEVWIYRVFSGTDYIVNVVKTNSQGEAIATLESGKIYKFVVMHDDYTTVTANKWVYPSVEDTKEFEMVGSAIITGEVSIISSCSKYMTTAGTCMLYMMNPAKENASNITIYSETNGTAGTFTSTTSCTTTYCNIHSTSVNWVNASWDIDIYANGDHIASVQYELRSYTWNIGIPVDFTASDNEDKALAILIIMLIATAIGGVANHIIPGSGIYTYAIMLFIWGVVLSVLAVPAVVASFMIILVIGKRMIPERSR